jgi:hypothetical protein
MTGDAAVVHQSATDRNRPLAPEHTTSTPASTLDTKRLVLDRQRQGNLSRTLPADCRMVDLCGRFRAPGDEDAHECFRRFDAGQHVRRVVAVGQRQRGSCMHQPGPGARWRYAARLSASRCRGHARCQPPVQPQAPRNSRRPVLAREGQTGTTLPVRGRRLHPLRHLCTVAVAMDLYASCQC